MNIEGSQTVGKEEQTMTDIPHYSMIIRWDSRSDIFVINVPELPGCHTHGETYEEALKNGIEVIELWLETAKDLGWSIPEPRVVDA
jgi:predicted RNase H-like HicB family nuclease